MINEKKINEAALGYLKSLRKDYKASEPGNENHFYYDYPIEEEVLEEQFIDNFKAGAQWMLQQFKKDLWHDAKEEPNDGTECLIDTPKGVYLCYWNSADECWDDEEKDDYFCGMSLVTRWCYIDDLLSKEGGEQ